VRCTDKATQMAIHAPRVAPCVFGRSTIGGVCVSCRPTCGAGARPDASRRVDDQVGFASGRPDKKTIVYRTFRGLRP
jgi:hypothetical protein